MIWGAFCANGVLPLKRIDGIMDKKMYRGILKHRAIPGGINLIGEGFIYQEDNDPKHSSRYCRDFLSRKEKNGKKQCINKLINFNYSCSKM